MSWTNGVQFTDSLVRDYLLKRGFNNALKNFDSDLKADKDKGFRIDKIIQYIQTCINNYDIDTLRTYWSHLESRLFCHFDQKHETTVRKMQLNLYRLYVVTCIQNGKRKECLDFYEKMTSEFQGLSEWKEWYALPFTSHPENNKHFAIYFTKQWSDTFMVSLYNFLSVSFASASPPDLIKALQGDKIKIQNLKAENEELKKKLADGNKDGGNAKKEPPNYVKYLGLPGTFEKPEPEVAQPQKKKLPFSFPSLKSSSLVKQKTNQSSKSSTTSSKQQSKDPVPNNQTGPVKQPSKGSPSTARSFTSKSPPTNSDIPRNSVSTVESQSGRSKKLTGYQLQRKELFGEKGVVIKPSKSSSGVDYDASGNMSTPQLTKINQQHRSESPTAFITKDSLPSSAAVNIHSKPPLYTDAGIRSGTPPSGTSPLISDASLIGSIVLSKSASTDVEVCSLTSTKQYNEHRSAVVQCRSNINNRICASCDADGVVKIWEECDDDLQTLATVMSLSTFQSLEWSHKKSDLLILGSSNGLLRLYDASAKQTVQDVNISSIAINQIKFQPQNNSFTISCCSNEQEITGKSQSKLQIWNFSESQVVPLRSVQSDSVKIECICYNPPGTILACAGSNGNITLYNTANYKVIASKKLHRSSVCTIQFSHDGNHIYSIGSDGNFVVWNILTNSDISELAIHPQAAGPFEVSGFSGYKQVHHPKGGQLFAVRENHVLTCDRNTAVLYNIDLLTSSLRKTMTLTGHRAPVLCVDWFPSSNQVVSASMDGKIRLSKLELN